MARSYPTAAPFRKRERRLLFLARTLSSLLEALERAYFAEELARTRGLLQRLDPRVKVIGLLLLILAAALARNVFVILGLFAAGLGLALLSHVPIRALAAREWLGVLLFTGIVALPAIFITPGRVVFRLPFWGWSLTASGLRSAVYLITRAETAATFSALLILCTPWTRVLKALRVLGMPVILIVILGTTHRYIFLMLQTAQEMFEARQSRMIGALDTKERRRLVVASAGVLLTKTLRLSSEVYLAMLSRGFRGEVYTIDDFRMWPRDWAALAGFGALAALAFWLGRW